MNKRKIKNKKGHKQTFNKTKTRHIDGRHNPHTKTTTYKRKNNTPKYQIHTN